MNKRELLETWFRRVWQEEDMEAIDEMMTASTEVRGLRQAPQVGPSDFKAFARSLLCLIKETHITIDHFMENGDWATVLMNISAKNRNTDQPLQFFGLALVRIVEDKIVEAYNYADFMELYEQLNLLPAGAMNHCLCGNSLR